MNNIIRIAELSKRKFEGKDERLPVGTESFVQVKKMYYSETKDRSSSLSHRLVNIASRLEKGGFVGWQVRSAETGSIDVALFGNGVTENELTWMFEKIGVVEKAQLEELPEYMVGSMQLYEISIPPSDEDWPANQAGRFSELVKALRDEGASMRCIFGKATENEIQNCKSEYFLKESAGVSKEYMGRPVKARCLMLFPRTPSVKFRVIIEEFARGFELLKVNSPDVLAEWNEPLRGARVLPEAMARRLAFEPLVEKNKPFGIITCDEPAPEIPLQESELLTDENTISIGKAINTAGDKINVGISDTDICCHYQIIGQTGTGKSTLLAETIVNSIKAGHGVTFFDPHGTTIDAVLRMVPRDAIDKVRVVRMGDADNPVPLTIWKGDTIEENERNISDLTYLFQEIFDHRQQGFAGPRWERFFAIFTKAALAIWGAQANFESIIAIAGNQEMMANAARQLEHSHPELYNSIRDEFGYMNKNDYAELFSWAISKFQRVLSVPELRNSLGAGINALEFDKVIDTDCVTMIDLSTPKLGISAARIVGCILLMQLWNAALERTHRDRPHLILMDEAHLFQTDPLPRMLSEGRKFGIGMVLAHQHSGQMSEEVRDALEANSASLSAFRLSYQDAQEIALRLEDSNLINTLCRLDPFKAITSIRAHGRQTKPFTLETTKPVFPRDAERRAALIEKNSIDRLVEPYRHLKVYGQEDFAEMIRKRKFL